MCQSDNCKSTLPVIGSFCPTSVNFSNDSLIRPLSHRTCNRPFGWPCQSARTVSCCSNRSTFWTLWTLEALFCVASLLLKQNSCIFEKIDEQLLWSLYKLVFSCRFVMPMQFSLLRRQVERPRIFVLIYYDWVLPTHKWGEWGPRNPSSFNIVEFLMTNCAPPLFYIMWKAFSAPLPFRASPWQSTTFKLKTHMKAVPISLIVCANK